MGKLLVTIIILGVSLLVFHVVLLRKPRPRWFWLSVDYFWFATVALGLIGATVNVRGMISADNYNEQYHDVDNLYQFTQERVRNHMLDLKVLETTEPEDAKDYRKAVEWCQHLQEVLTDRYGSESWNDFMRV